MFSGARSPRGAAYEALHTVLATLSRDDFEQRCAARDRAFRDQGITFSHSGEETPVPARPRAAHHRRSRVGRHRSRRAPAGPRARALPGRRLRRRARSLPTASCPADSSRARRTSIAASPGIEPPGGVRIHVAGIDLVRDDAGQLPRARRQPAHTVGDLVRRGEPARDDARVPRALRQPSHPPRLRLPATPARGVTEHRTRGSRRTRAWWCSRRACTTRRTSSTRSSPDRWASSWSRAATSCAATRRVYMRTTAGEQRVDVVYRRIDDDYLDPLQFRPDSVLGCAGIVNAPRAGNVTIANTPGNGVADDKAVYPFVPAMIEYYLGEVPILANVETYRLEDPDVCEWVVERVDQLVCKPADGSGGYGLVIGPQASEQTLVDLREQARRKPAGLDRAAARRAVDGAHVRRRQDGAAPPRPPAVRGERRPRHLGRAGRSHAGGASRGKPRRELQSGRWLEGHVGALGRPPAGARMCRRRLPRVPPIAPTTAPALGPMPVHDGQQQQQQ